MAENQTVLQIWLEVCHQNFSGWEISNHNKFTEECVIYTEKHVLIKKCLQIG